ncbi:hypothetical protein LF65_01632 [Clostridium beijerinckii]|uniref:PKD domain-containing protein n=1 Tax=Clostridium beijerinckii TaxID=1520 RepID=A0A0B5QK04_CLOBE|nr:hypothetical protein [Clostridium beijerinckii]AJG98237.1 hypothetical protein LF65_01632 [Clostridium beijerinckii]
MTTVKEIYDAKKDLDYKDPYVDIEEWRERVLSDGTTIPYLYVHGGFANKGVKFVLCFPKQDEFKGRFFQYLSPFPGPDEEVASLDKTGEDDKIAFCLQNGAYFVESNMGSKHMFGGSSERGLVWKSSAAVAEYSRIKAMKIYGCERPYGYVHGGSGGGYKTMACIENTCAWDGAVPYVIGSPVSLPNTITLHAQGQRVLRNVFGKIVDSLDAGGSGNMYEGLTEDESFMLKEITAMGFPPRAWYLEAEGVINDGSLPVLTPGVKASDPQYFKDFWEIPGYLGSDSESNAVRDRLKFSGVVKSVHIPGSKNKNGEVGGLNGVDDAWKKMLTDGNDAWIELEAVPQGDDLYLNGVNIHFETGAAKGKQLALGSIQGNCLLIGMSFGISDIASVLSEVQPGDKVVLDNSDYIAIQSYYRHQVPQDQDFHAWDQFRDEEGNPTIPQRPNVMGYSLTGTGTVQDGDLQGKVIVIQSLMDESTCPWCADWYRKKVIEKMGDERNFRLYYMDRCMHGDASWLENNMVTNYLGALRQALLDLSNWVERGIEPCKSTVYTLSDGQIYPAATASERKGLQPVVTMLANGNTCAHVKAGETVKFTVMVEVPEGAGKVTAVDYDFVSDNSLSMEKKELTVFQIKGTFEHVINGQIHGAVSEMTHIYKEPGTYFASVRVKSNRVGDASNVFTQVKNIARVRVIVEYALKTIEH